MWSRSGVERNSLNSKPDSVKITTSLRKLRKTADEEDNENKRYNLTPMSSLRITSQHVRKTIVNLNKESTNIFTLPKSPKKIGKSKSNSGNAASLETFNDKNSKEKMVTNQNRKRSEKDSQTKHNGKTYFKPQQNHKQVELSQIKHKQEEKKNKSQRLSVKLENKSVDFERMLRLGLALDWNQNRNNVKSQKSIIRKHDTDGSKASALNSFRCIMGPFSGELDSMQSQLENKRSKDEQATVQGMVKSSLENGWINYGNQRNCQLPHQYMCPFKENLEDKFGRIDGLVTLEALMEYAYETKEKATPCDDINVTSRGKRSTKYSGVKDPSPIKCRSSIEKLPERGAKSHCELSENLTNLSFNKATVSEKSQLWMEKANRWANSNDDLNNLTDEEKLTRAWKESLARWEAEKRDLLAEVSKNHYAIGIRFQNNSAENQQYSSNPEKDTQHLTSSRVSCPSKKNRQYPSVMSKGDIKAFCFHWDQATEPIRNTLMIKFLKLYSEWDDPLDMNGLLNCGANLLFMRFAFGFKVSFIKKYRCWRYIECVLIFLQSLESETFAKQLLEINILEDILELVRYDESYLFDKLQSLYFLSTLLEGPIGEDVMKTISNSGKLMDLLLEFFIRCEDPQTLVLCRNILLTIVNKTDLNISQVILEAISHLKMNEQTPLKIELVFQVIKSFLCIHPMVINNCGPIILENLNTKDINIMLGIGDLAATTIKHSQCYAVIEHIFEKALSPFIDITYRHEYDETMQKISEKVRISYMKNGNMKVFKDNRSHHASSNSKRFSQRQNICNSNLNHSDCQQNEQFSACFVINYILENQDSSKILCEYGVIGLSLIAAGQNSSKKIQQEGIRMICSLHQRSFECAASYTLLLSDEILSNILAREIECLNKVSCDVLLHMRQLGYVMLENWKMWNEQVLLPTKLELKKDFESAMSKEEDYTVDINYSAAHDTSKCQQAISDALKTPLGQQVAEILGKLKSAWSKIDDDTYTNTASGSTLTSRENQYDGESNSYCSSSSAEDWVTYNTNEPDSKSTTNYFSKQTRRNNNDSYIEEIEDTDCDSIPLSYHHNGDDAVTSEDEISISDFRKIPINYSLTVDVTPGKATKGARKKKSKTTSLDQDEEIRQIAAQVSSMRKIIQKFQ